MPEIRPIVLREELMKSYREVNDQVDEVKREAMLQRTTPEQLRTPSGNFVLIPLITARAQILHALTLLNQKGN